jgi:hypothetical protein
MVLTWRHAWRLQSFFLAFGPFRMPSPIFLEVIQVQCPWKWERKKIKCNELKEPTNLGRKLLGEAFTFALFLCICFWLNFLWRFDRGLVNGMSDLPGFGFSWQYLSLVDCSFFSNLQHLGSLLAFDDFELATHQSWGIFYTETYLKRTSSALWIETFMVWNQFFISKFQNKENSESQLWFVGYFFQIQARTLHFFGQSWS